MIGKYLRPGISKIINPIARGLLKIGVTPNMVTVFGTVLNITLAIVFIAATNHIIIGSLLLGLTVFVDLVDGAMARQIGHGTPYGAILDATLDRVADGAVFGSILWWAMENRAGDTWLLITTLVTLVFSEVISYAKARAEASGIPVSVGLIERPERLIISLVCLCLTGIGIHYNVRWLSYCIDAAMWVLAIGSIFTVIQRLYVASKAPNAREDFIEQDN